MLLAVAAVAVFATVGSAGAAQTTSQVMLGSGSDTTWLMMDAFDDMYNQSPGCNQIANPQPLDGSCASGNLADAENFYHNTAAERYWIGSGGGINQLCKQGLANVANMDYARSSRVPLPAAQGGSDCTGLHFVGYARDGIAWECFPGVNAGCTTLTTGTNSLTITQLKHIWVDCTITNWNQIGGSNKTIDVYAAQANSGTGVSWAAALGVTLASGQALSNCVANPNNPNQPGSNISAENTNALIHINGDEDNAIYYYSVGVYHRTYGKAFTGADGSSLGLVNGKKATSTAIQNGSFPISRYLFNVYCAGDPANANKCGNNSASPSWVKDYVGEHGFICKSEDDHLDSNNQPIKDPLTGAAYRLPANLKGQPKGEISDLIKAQGFVPVAQQADGTYCVTFTT